MNKSCENCAKGKIDHEDCAECAVSFLVHWEPVNHDTKYTECVTCKCNTCGDVECKAQSCGGAGCGEDIPNPVLVDCHGYCAMEVE